MNKKQAKNLLIKKVEPKQLIHTVVGINSSTNAYSKSCVMRAVFPDEERGILIVFFTMGYDHAVRPCSETMRCDHAV